ncbi:nicotinate-nucleotide adenylyltransferase [Tissierella sp. MSJ-40]|uniref:Probable nicotinate-nucleotide adenylyltransferase n=1 Tax=Tissierella simiarum TaxID=2841534 RepID=A0ABS6EAR5_9FIRM|nr:nicotinate-nucleotide adenylyltransferase [Tissierella simiarum]MBU5440011.1 nicotinate-nucleotide adenylyltransferase [Tissierella simiarum]
MKIGIMGGTFNPIHNGHLIMAEYTRYSLNLDKVLFIPTGKPPHKEIEEVAYLNHRLEMTVLATLSNSFFQVSSMEIERKNITYTIDTIEALKEEYPKDEFYFIIGADSLFEIEKWKDYKKLLGLCNFAVVERPNYNNDKIVEKIQNLKTLHNSNIVKVDSPLIEISSTEIRNRVNKGQSIKYLVPESVEDYITKYGLYK